MFVEKDVFSSLCVLHDFVKNQVGVAVWFYICIYYNVPLILSVFVPVPYMNMGDLSIF
jgi:hypothetical protein